MQLPEAAGATTTPLSDHSSAEIIAFIDNMIRITESRNKELRALLAEVYDCIDGVIAMNYGQQVLLAGVMQVIVSRTAAKAHNGITERLVHLRMQLECKLCKVPPQ